MEMMEMFNLIIQKGITPDQFYLLYCIREGIASVHINVHQALRELEFTKWIEPIVPGELTKLSPKAITLLQQVESFFHVQKKKTAMQSMGNDYATNIEKYLLLFPKLKLPSGKPARSDKRNVETAFKWFFENHDYTWEIVLGATARYVDEYERKNYLYMQTSQYFIRKQQADKTWGSELGNCCASLLNGDDQDEGPRFEEKVF
jgi:hypothetical protein